MDDELAGLVVHRSGAAASQVWPGTVKWIENKTIQLNKIAIWIDFQFCPWVKNGITFYCTWNHNYHKSMWSNLQKVCCGLLGSLSVSALSKYLGNIRSHNEWSQARRGEAETNVGVSTLHRRLSPLTHCLVNYSYSIAECRISHPICQPCLLNIAQIGSMPLRNKIVDLLNYFDYNKYFEFR